MPGKKKESDWFSYKKLQIISKIYKLYVNNFWWDCLKVSEKMDLTIRMKTFNNIKQYDAIRDRFFTSLIVLGLELKTNIWSTIKDNFLSYCCTSLAFVITVMI